MPRTYVFNYLALLVLTALTTGVAFFDMGPFNTVAAIVIAGLKALLIGLFFMHLTESPILVRVTVIGALIWFSFLMTLTMGDYITRGWLPIPGK